MKILIVCATFNEVQLIQSELFKDANLVPGQLLVYKNLEISILITGVGMVATTYFLVKIVLQQKFDLVLNVGVAGCFSSDVDLGEVFNVVSDCFADAGAEDNTNFISLFDMKLVGPDEFPFSKGLMLNPYSNKSNVIKQLPRANSITVSKAHGNRKSIEAVIEFYHPDMESMEGAAVFYVCLMEKVPFLQIRSISNFIEKRNKDNWNMPLALENLKDVVIRFLDEL